MQDIQWQTWSLTPVSPHLGFCGLCGVYELTKFLPFVQLVTARRESVLMVRAGVVSFPFLSLTFAFLATKVFWCTKVGICRQLSHICPLTWSGGCGRYPLPKYVGIMVYSNCPWSGVPADAILAHIAAPDIHTYAHIMSWLDKI
jgi:hypothetical protein